MTVLVISEAETLIFGVLWPSSQVLMGLSHNYRENLFTKCCNLLRILLVIIYLPMLGESKILALS